MNTSPESLLFYCWLLYFQQFLLLEERSVLETPFQLNIWNVGRPPLPDEVALRFDDYTASWGKDKNSLSLEAINFTVQKVIVIKLMWCENFKISKILRCINKDHCQITTKGIYVMAKKISVCLPILDLYSYLFSNTVLRIN